MEMRGPKSPGASAGTIVYQVQAWAAAALMRSCRAHVYLLGSSAYESLVRLSATLSSINLCSRTSHAKGEGGSLFLHDSKGRLCWWIRSTLRGILHSQGTTRGVSHLKSQTQSKLPAYGKILGYELTKEEEYGSSVVKLIYILKSEKAPTVWEFIFYKPNESWYLVNATFSDQFTGLR